MLPHQVVVAKTKSYSDVEMFGKVIGAARSDTGLGTFQTTVYSDTFGSMGEDSVTEQVISHCDLWGDRVP